MNGIPPDYFPTLMLCSDEVFSQILGGRKGLLSLLEATSFFVGAGGDNFHKLLSV